MPKGMTQMLPNVLLVEDNDDDVMLTREGLAEAGVPADMRRVANGFECMAYLRREAAYADAPIPDLILLDLNMPLMDGREVLSRMRAEDAFQAIPVVMLTTSSAPEDITAAYRLHANAYVIKPTRFLDFVSVLRAIGEFWFGANSPPFRQAPRSPD